jgi:hypothetical protein
MNNQTLKLAVVLGIFGSMTILYSKALAVVTEALSNF